MMKLFCVSMRVSEKVLTNFLNTSFIWSMSDILRTAFSPGIIFEKRKGYGFGHILSPKILIKNYLLLFDQAYLSFPITLVSIIVTQTSASLFISFSTKIKEQGCSCTCCYNSSNDQKKLLHFSFSSSLYFIAPSSGTFFYI